VPCWFFEILLLATPGRRWGCGEQELFVFYLVNCLINSVLKNTFCPAGLNFTNGSSSQYSPPTGYSGRALPQRLPVAGKSRAGGFGMSVRKTSPTITPTGVIGLRTAKSAIPTPHLTIHLPSISRVRTNNPNTRFLPHPKQTGPASPNACGSIRARVFSDYDDLLKIYERPVVSIEVGSTLAC